MRKEFVVMRIDAAPDGAPYVVVSLSLAKDMKEGNQPPSQLGSNVMGFTNMDDMMKNVLIRIINLGSIFIVLPIIFYYVIFILIKGM